MENSSLTHNSPSNLLPFRIPALNITEPKLLAEQRNLQNIFSSPINDLRLPLKNLNQTQKNPSLLDFNQIIQVSKGLKSLDPAQQSQIESILASKDSKIPGNLLQELLQTLSKKESSTNNQVEERDGDDNETLSENLSDDLSLDHTENRNLLDNVKENLNLIVKREDSKKKNSEKRWWTSEEVKLNPLFHMF